MKVEGLQHVIKVVEEYVERVYSENWGKYPTSHDYLHVIRVLRVAEHIAEAENLSCEERLMLKIACLLHDIAIPLRGSKENHAAESAEIARKFLRKAGLSGEHIAEICRAISEHSWSEGRKPSSKISAILQDADRIDALGVVGFARMICYGEYMKRKLHHPVEIIPKERELNDEAYTLDHVFTKLINIPKTMNTNIGKAIAQERLRKLIELVKKFEHEASLK